MCQKAHGAAFGAYCMLHAGEIRWIGSTENIRHYESSEFLTRSSCGVCGSVVPYPDKAGAVWAVPAGCHPDAAKPDYNIFVADNAPWHTVSGNLTACDSYPKGSGLRNVASPPVSEKVDGVVRGSCLCGEITYQVTEPFKIAHNCHCSRCRYGRATAHASNGFVSYDGLDFLSGEDKVKTYKVPDAQFFTQAFCEVCSALMPRKDAERQICVIPLGSLDDDPGIKPVDHIFVKDKADWHDITDGLPQYQQGPPA